MPLQRISDEKGNCNATIAGVVYAARRAANRGLEAKSFINDLSCIVPLSTPKASPQHFMLQQVLSNSATEESSDFHDEDEYDADDGVLVEDYLSPVSRYVSGLLTLLFGNPIEIFDRLGLIIQRKQGGNDSKDFDDEIVAKTDQFLSYK